MAEETLISLEELKTLHPADIADHLQRWPSDEAHEVFRQLPTELAAEALSELDPERREEFLVELPEQQLAALFVQLPHNEVADIAAQLSPERQQAILARLPVDESRSIRKLLSYPEDTAGGLMSDHFLTIRERFTLLEALEHLRRRREDSGDGITYLYVTNEDERLVGVVSLRDLVFGDSKARVADIMNREVKALNVSADQEEIARNFEHYHYLGLPVLDMAGRLVGVVKMSEALSVAQEEATEDMQLMVGLSGEERALTPWKKAVTNRLPWLYLNLVTAVVAAGVVGLFEETIAAWTALALFLPIVAGQGGNAGMQTLTVIIRDLALGELSPGDGRRALMKELMTGLVNGIAIGVVVGIIGYLWKGSFTLGVVAGVAMVLTQLSAALSGVLVPFGLKLFKVDPALAASIFVTTVTDVAGFFFFLGLAALALKYWGI